MAYGRNPDSISYGFSDSFGASKPKGRDYDYGDGGYDGDYEVNSFLRNIRRLNNGDQNTHKSSNKSDSYQSKPTSSPETLLSSNKRDTYDDSQGSSVKENHDPDESDRKPSVNAQSNNPARDKPLSDTYNASNNIQDPYSSPGTGGTDASVKKNTGLATNDPRYSSDEPPYVSPGIDSSSKPIQPGPASHVVTNSSEAAPNAPTSAAADLYADFDNRNKIASKMASADERPSAAPRDDSYVSRGPEPPHAPSYGSSSADVDSRAASPAYATSDQTTSRADTGGVDWLHKGVKFVAQKAGRPVVSRCGLLFQFCRCYCVCDFVHGFHGRLLVCLILCRTTRW
jgi:hypothetical protein